jgi:hypothetical protein
MLKLNMLKQPNEKQTEKVQVPRVKLGSSGRYEYE